MNGTHADTSTSLSSAFIYDTILDGITFPTKNMFCQDCGDLLRYAHGAWFHSGPPETSTIARNVASNPPVAPRKAVGLPAPLPIPDIPITVNKRVRIL